MKATSVPAMLLGLLLPALAPAIGEMTVYARKRRG
jgi:hypothetical protein